MNKGRKLLSKNLWRIMLERNMTEEDLAKVSGVHFNTIRSWVTMRHPATLDNVVKLADSLNIELSELFKS